MPLFDVYPLYEVTPVRALGTELWDDNGNKYLDLYGGHAVISIGHSHPDYVGAMTAQLQKLAFYSNAVQNPLLEEVAQELEVQSSCFGYQLFMCNSGAEANENALKLASFVTGRSRIIAFKNSFHGRTSAAVAATDNPSINAPINSQHHVSFLTLNDIRAVQKELEKEDVAAIIIEVIQGVGGLDKVETEFYKELKLLCQKHGSLLIADEVQCGFGRSGKFFAFQHHEIQPDIISIAKGMGNGFPVGGILIHPDIKPKHGMLGTTFGGNHLACVAVLTVLKVIQQENLIARASELEHYFINKAQNIPGLLRIKGQGLMLGLEFDFPVAELRKKLIYEKHIFTGGSSNKNLIRILPPLTIQEHHFDYFFDSLKSLLS